MAQRPSHIPVGGFVLKTMAIKFLSKFYEGMLLLLVIVR